MVRTLKYPVPIFTHLAGAAVLIFSLGAGKANAGCQDRGLAYEGAAGKVLTQIAQELTALTGCNVMLHPSLYAETTQQNFKISSLEELQSLTGSLTLSRNLFLITPKGTELKLPGTGRLVSLSLNSAKAKSVKKILAELGLKEPLQINDDETLTVELADVALDDIPALLQLLRK